MKVFKYMSAGLLTLALASCGGDYLNTEYTTYLDQESAGTAAAAQPDVFLNGMWSWQVDWNKVGNDGHDDFGYMSVMMATQMMSEDIAINRAHWFRYDYEFDYRLESWARTMQFWTEFYTDISKANEIIGLYPDGGSTKEEKGLLGQALAMRGMAYTYLIQLYQKYIKADGTVDREAPGVPLMYTLADGLTQDEIDAAKGRNTVGEVLDQAEKDLTRAVECLGAGYVRPSGANGKDYIDQSVAYGLLARLYLVRQDWDKAAAAANAARQGYSLRTAAELQDGFMDVTASDVMWGFNHTTETSTAYASFFSHISNLAPGYAGLAYCSKLIDARLYDRIPDTDARKAWFNGPNGDNSQPTSGAKLPYANLKFGNDGSWTMDYIFMRAAEMVLIEAEAYAHMGNTTQAAQVMKELMQYRDPQWNMPNVSVEDVYLQRRIELWGEGFSFFDLKRLNKGIDRNYEGTNHLSGYLKTIPAGTVDWTFQIPLREIQENPLISEDDQNP